VEDSKLSHLLRGVQATFGRHAMPLWTIIIVIGFAAFAYRQQHEIGSLGGALATAGPGWLIALVALQAIAIGCTVVTYRVILGRLGHDLGRSRLTLLHLQRHVAGTLTPIGGPASAYVFVRGLASRQVPAEDSVLTLGLRGVSGYAAFVTLLIPGLLIARPSPIVLVAAGSLALVLVVMLAGAILVLRGEPGDRLPGWLPARAAEFVSQTRAHRLCMSDLVAPYLLAMLLNLTGVAMLFVSLRALGQDVSPASVLAAFAAGNLFAIVAPVFQGVGVVEASMAVTLQGFGIPGAAALGATLLYRLADVWLPLGLGLLAQAGQQQQVRRIGLPIAGLSTGAAALGWLVMAGGEWLPPAQVVALGLAAGAAGIVLVHAPWRGQPSLRLAPVGLAIGIVPVAVLAELDRLTTVSIQVTTLASMLVT
jgi:uncharacterized membrane protein YbhN (UPF0104 family)